MKRFLITIACMLLFAFSYGQNTKSYYHKEGFLFEIGSHKTFGDNMYAFMGTLTFGYKQANGFDYSYNIEWDVNDMHVGLVWIHYAQVRFHPFDYKISPFIGAGLGMNHYWDLNFVAPAIRCSIGASYDFFSIYCSYAYNIFLNKSYILLPEGNNIFKLGLTIAF